MDDWFIVSTSESEAVSYVWSSATRTVHATLKGNSGVAGGAVVIANSSLVSSQSARAALHVWNLPGESPWQKSPVPEKMGPLAATQDYLFAGGKSGRLYVWAIGSGALINSVAAHYREVTALAVTGDGACVVSGGDDGIIHVWLVSALVDVKSQASPSAQHTWSSHGLRVTGLLCGLGPYGETVVVSSSLDSTVKVWKLPQGALVADTVYSSAITCVAMDAFERIVFAGAADGTIFCSRFAEEPLQRNASLSNEGDGSNDRNVLCGHAGAITALRVVTQGMRQVLVSASSDKQVHLWDVESGQMVASFRKHTAAVTSLAVLATLPPSISEGGGHARVAVVGKLQKYPRGVGPGGDVPAESALHWTRHLRAQDRDALPRFQDECDDDDNNGDAGVVMLPADSDVGDDAQRRIDELEAEVARLRADNRTLFEFNVDRVVKSDKKRAKRPAPSK